MSYATLSALLGLVLLQALAPLWLFLRRAEWLSAKQFSQRYGDKRWLINHYPWLFWLFFSVGVGVTFQIDRLTQTPTEPLVFYCYSLIVTMYGGFELTTQISIRPSYRWRGRIIPAQFVRDERVRWAGLTRLATGLLLLAATFIYWSR